MYSGYAGSGGSTQFSNALPSCMRKSGNAPPWHIMQCHAMQMLRPFTNSSFDAYFANKLSCVKMTCLHSMAMFPGWTWYVNSVTCFVMHPKRRAASNQVFPLDVSGVYLALGWACLLVASPVVADRTSKMAAFERCSECVFRHYC